MAWEVVTSSKGFGVTFYFQGHLYILYLDIQIELYIFKLNKYIHLHIILQDAEVVPAAPE